jgi:hypothetical protein
MSASAIQLKAWPSMLPALRGGLEGALAQGFGGIGAALPGGQQRFDEQRQPVVGLAEDDRRAPPGEHVGPQCLAVEGFPVHLGHRQGRGVEFGGHVELVEGALPLPLHGQQLKRKMRSAASPGLARTALWRSWRASSTLLPDGTFCSLDWVHGVGPGLVQPMRWC